MRNVVCIFQYDKTYQQISLELVEGCWNIVDWPRQWLRTLDLHWLVAEEVQVQPDRCSRSGKWEIVRNIQIIIFNDKRTTHDGMVLEILNLDDGWFAIDGGVGDLNGTLPWKNSASISTHFKSCAIYVLSEHKFKCSEATSETRNVFFSV